MTQLQPPTPESVKEIRTMMCKLCGEELRAESLIEDAFRVSCKTCGRYDLSGTAWAIVSDTALPDTLKKDLRQRIVKENEQGKIPSFKSHHFRP